MIGSDARGLIRAPQASNSGAINFTASNTDPLPLGTFDLVSLPTHRLTSEAGRSSQADHVPISQ
eukprot:3712466-Prymnesium_polylepis.1